MNEKPLTAGQVFGMAAVLTVFAGIALTIVPGWHVISAWMKSPEAPAWVQGVGSIAAIVAAIIIAKRQDNRQRRQRILAAADRYLEMFAPALALSEAAVAQYGALYDDLISDDFAFDLGFGTMPKRLLAESDAIAEGFSEIKPTSMPTVDSINTVRALGRLISRARVRLHELADLCHRDPDRPYPQKQREFLQLLEEMKVERNKLRRELVRITDPGQLE